MNWLRRLFRRDASPTAAPSGDSQHAEESFDLGFIKEQALNMMNQVNESVQIAHNSKNPETKVSRLEFAKSRLTELQLLTVKHPFLSITNLDGMLGTFAQLEDEFSKAGYYALTDPSLLDYTPSVSRHIQDDSLIAGWMYSATIQLRTPLRVLNLHGEKVSADHGRPVETETQHGAWVPVLKTYSEMGFQIPEIDRTSASDVGQIPADGGKYLQLLKSLRQIVEAPEEIPARLAQLRAELSKPAWAEFVTKLGGRESIYAKFFPAFIETIPSIPATAVEAMWAAELTTPRAISEASDAELLSIKGIGPVKLKAIRAACEAAQDKDAERLDMVTR